MKTDSRFIILLVAVFAGFTKGHQWNEDDCNGPTCGPKNVCCPCQVWSQNNTIFLFLNEIIILFEGTEGLSFDLMIIPGLASKAFSFPLAYGKKYLE